MNLYIFDFDGTLYNGDSMFDFAKFSNKKRYYFSLFLLIPIYVFFKLGIISNKQLKEKFLQFNFKGKSDAELSRLGESFFLSHQHKLFPSAVQYLKGIDESDAKKLIVSGSSKEWIFPFARFLDAELISSQLNFENSIFTGNLNGENCIGQEKVKRIQQTMNLDIYRNVIAFGNSKEDLELKSIASSYFHLHFST